ncbi:MAG: 1-acyl-sn-glycerol-3-phosphate acyltransferase [Cyanobacteria bacterium RYN_339]|nr:1-acyl-sn-glycerol-3-phosphate acyltransferase [Cyanobacteria bacterium RYN_339]
MRLLVSLYMWSAWLLAGLVGIPILLAMMVLCSRRTAYEGIRTWIRVSLAISFIKVRWTGIDKLDTQRPYILMGNHINLLDPFIWCLAIPVPFVGVEKKENFKIPFYGWLMSRWGNIGIDRKDLEQAKRDLERAGELIRRDNLWIALMPEGTRTRDGKLAAFKKGGFHLALGTGAPIVPITMNGAYDIQARGGFWARPGTIDLIFGEPIDPANYGPERLDDLIRDVRAAIVGPYTGPKSELDRTDVPTLVTP